jgi:hypothetical protein
MTKKQTQQAWTYGAIGFGLAALIAMPAIQGIINYYRAGSNERDVIKGLFDAAADVKKNG